MANCVDPDQTSLIGLVCSGSTLFASILNLSVILGNYLQQTTSADEIFKWEDRDQWCSQNAEKVTHIKGRLLDQAMILFNCFPFQNGNSLREQILSFMSSMCYQQSLRSACTYVQSDQGLC